MAWVVRAVLIGLLVFGLDFGTEASVYSVDNRPVSEQLTPEDERQFIDFAGRYFEAIRHFETLDREVKRFGTHAGNLLAGFEGPSTGLRIDVMRLEVDSVAPGSPAALAGFERGDRIVEINGRRSDGSAVQNFEVFWQHRRSEVGDTLSVMVSREGEEMEIEASLEVLARDELMHRERQVQMEQADPVAARAHARASFIRQRLYEVLGSAFGEDRFGAWDGLVLFTVDEGLAHAMECEAGITVFHVAAEDHPLQVGDVLTRVGVNAPSDAAHAAQLLYGFDTEEFVKIDIRRDGRSFHLEVPYPAAEVIPTN